MEGHCGTDQEMIRIQDSSMDISSLGLHDLSWYLGFSIHPLHLFHALVM